MKDNKITLAMVAVVALTCGGSLVEGCLTPKQGMVVVSDLLKFVADIAANECQPDTTPGECRRRVAARLKDKDAFAAGMGGGGGAGGKAP